MPLGIWRARGSSRRRLEGGRLRIGPGTEVLFADDAGLFVSREGGKASLEVAGDEEGKVVFRAEKGEAPGQWAGVEVAPSAGDVSLRHLTIDSAGGFNTSAALDVEEVDIHGTT